MGKLEVATGSFEGGLYVLAGSCLVSGICILALRMLVLPRQRV